MALIHCPECNHQVSDTAAACPSCGAAISSAKESKAAGATLRTVQLTSKKLKLQSLISAVLAVIGFIWLMIATNTAPEGEELSAWPSLLLTVGVIWFLVTRVRIWWHHK